MVTDGNDALSPALPNPSARAAGQASSLPQSADLRVIHLRLPAPYLAANWPLSHAALSSDGMDIAVAGRYGLALYSRRTARWRLFGDVSQERDIAVHVGLLFTCRVYSCGKSHGKLLMHAERYQAKCSATVSLADVFLTLWVYVQHLMWLPRIVLACVSQASSKAAGSSELLLYPRYHLDNASLLAQYHLPQVRAARKRNQL